MGTKTKEAFGWPEDSEEFAGGAAPSTHQQAATACGFEAAGEEGGAAAPWGNKMIDMDLSLVDKVVATALDTMEGLLTLTGDSSGTALVSEKHSSSVQLIATRLLVAAGPPPVTKAAKSVLYSVHPSRTACHTQTDAALLQHAAAAILQAQPDQQLDVEQFHHLVVTARSVAKARPRNLVSFARRLEEEEESKEGNYTSASTGTCRRFVELVVAAFWRLLAEIPANSASGALGQPGLTHVELTVQYLVDIMHALTLADMEQMAVFTAGHYIKYLLCSDQRVSFSARAAIVRAVRPKLKRKRGNGHSAGVGTFLPTGSNKEVSEALPERPSAPAPPIRSSMANSRRQQQQQHLHLQEQESLMDYEEGEEVHDLNRGPGGVHLGGVAGNLDALLPLGGMAANLPAMLDLPADEAMVELAIALSLQDQEDVEAEVGALAQGLQGLQQLANLGQGLAGILGGQEQDSDGEDVVEVDEDVDDEEEEDGDEEDEEEEEERANNRAHDGDNNGDSDSTASAPGSDDERDPSAVHPADEGPRSDSGGSLDDIIGAHHTGSAEAARNTFGFGSESDRETARSIGGDVMRQNQEEGAMAASGLAAEEGGVAAAAEVQLTAGLRQILLEQLVASLGSLRQVGGRCTIPYMQLALALTTDLDPEEGRDVAALRSLLAALLQELGVGGEAVDTNINYAERDQQREFQLIIMRLLSVLMSRCSRSSSNGGQSETAENFVARTVAGALAAHGMHGHCLTMLKSLLPYWQSQTGATATLDDVATAEASPSVPGSQMLKPAPPTPLPDMAPFFLKQYVKTHASDIFEAYPQLLTEMALRLPYQMKKIADGGGEGTAAAPHFEADWLYQLCELLATPQAPFVKRQVRKLLLLICGSRDQYRQLRDMHTLETKMR